MKQLAPTRLTYEGYDRNASAIGARHRNQKADCLFGGGMNWTPRHGPRVLLGGADPIELTVDQLEALAWWMRNEANGSGV
jgi:hypothetical protein